MASSALPVETPRAILDDQFFSQAVRALCERDGDLAAVVEKFGPPPFWKREPGFPTLVYIILEQQVSLASARALYSRLQEAVRPFTPSRFLKLTEAEMRRLVDRNRSIGGWLIFVTHDVIETPSPYGCKPGQLEAVVAYAAKRTTILPVRDVVAVDR